jgi:hypothetical protein
VFDEPRSLFRLLLPLSLLELPPPEGELGSERGASAGGLAGALGSERGASAGGLGGGLSLRGLSGIGFVSCPSVTTGAHKPKTNSPVVRTPILLARIFIKILLVWDETER